MRRREFITLLGSGAAAAWPFVAQAQQSERARRIGVLMALPKDNPEGQARIAAFLQELSNWAGPNGAICKLSTDGRPPNDYLYRIQESARIGARCYEPHLVWKIFLPDIFWL